MNNENDKKLSKIECELSEIASALIDLESAYNILLEKIKPAMVFIINENIETKNKEHVGGSELFLMLRSHKDRIFSLTQRINYDINLIEL